MFILLDRNAISYIKSFKNGNNVDIKFLQKLRRIDHKRHFISPLLSVMEGRLAKNENEQETLETLSEEAALVRFFFKRARSDSEYLLNFKESFSKACSQQMELNFEKYILFIKKFQPIFVNYISRSKQLNNENDIFKYAKEKGIDKQHIVVIFALSCLYGCDQVRSIMKKNKNKTQDENAYNTIQDILSVIRFINLSNMVNNYNSPNSPNNSKYLTFDKGLEFLHDSVKVDNVNVTKNLSDFDIRYSLLFNNRLFPNLNNLECKNLLKRIKS